MLRQKPSPYEKKALDEIHAWRNPEKTTLGWLTGKVSGAMQLVSDQVRRVPGIDWTIENVISGLFTIINEIAQDMVWRDAIYEEFRDAGHSQVFSWKDLRALKLEDIDQRVNGLATKYGSLAVVEGAATGLAGASGILPDIVALVALNLRAAGEYATYYGFDLDLEVERVFALQILEAASQSRVDGIDSGRQDPDPVSNRVARQKTLRTVRSVAIGGAATPLVRSLATRLARVKLAQLLPIASAVVAGGFNGHYTNTVCESAFYLYRERFLTEKYGEEFIQR